MRAQAAGNAATVRVLLAHEMESGQRKDGSGKTVPAWHIQQVSVLHNGKAALTAEWGPSVAKNPLLQLSQLGAKTGDKIGVRWQDNRGESRFDEAPVG
ncbi:MAG: thiosulfate oxidation carrier complex protein SoxZ, partial [Burkholderiaceae bacterium]